MSDSDSASHSILCHDTQDDVSAAEITTSKSTPTFSLKSAQKFKEKTNKTGLIYLSRIPPHMKPEKVRHLLSQYGEIGRIYLVPEGTGIFLRFCVVSYGLIYR
jgi:ESF2/ABP1 family protein